MKQSVSKKVKGLFGSGFRKKIRKANSLKELRKRLAQKKIHLENKIKNCDSGSEQKLLQKKIKVLAKQMSKIDKKLE